jgi:hypothetical protein
MSSVELPAKDFYLKNIHKSSVNDPFFIHLKTLSGLKPIVDESINNYLHDISFNFEEFKSKISQQLDKKFMLWNNEMFFIDYLTEEDIDIIPEYTLKKGRNGYNTIVIHSKNKNSFHLLLRWKNHAGVLFPAWQIKFNRKDK